MKNGTDKGSAVPAVGEVEPWMIMMIINANVREDVYIKHLKSGCIG